MKTARFCLLNFGLPADYRILRPVSTTCSPGITIPKLPASSMPMTSPPPARVSSAITCLPTAATILLSVYNFQVEDYHTYYVTGSGALVHNSCAHQTPTWKSVRSSYWKAQAASGVNDTWYPLTRKNLELMSQGKAPFGYDNKRVVLHHVSGISNNMYDFVEMGATAHQAFHKAFGCKDFIDIL